MGLYNTFHASIALPWFHVGINWHDLYTFRVDEVLQHECWLPFISFFDMLSHYLEWCIFQLATFSTHATWPLLYNLVSGCNQI